MPQILLSPTLKVCQINWSASPLECKPLEGTQGPPNNDHPYPHLHHHHHHHQELLGELQVENHSILTTL